MFGYGHGEEIGWMLNGVEDHVPGIEVIGISSALRALCPLPL